MGPPVSRRRQPGTKLATFTPDGGRFGLSPRDCPRHVGEGSQPRRLAAMEGRLPDAVTAEVEFKGPVGPLPFLRCNVAGRIWSERFAKLLRA